VAGCTGLRREDLHPICGWWLLTWFDVEQSTARAGPGQRSVGALLGPERTTCCGLHSLAVVAGAGGSLVSGGGLRVWLSSAEWTRASFFLTCINRARWLPCGGLVCAVFGLLDDCVAGVGVLVKLSRAHGGCLGIRSR
jgi:hypothetical protein